VEKKERGERLAGKKGGGEDRMGRVVRKRNEEKRGR